MKLPPWLHTRTSRRTGGTVTFTIEADVSKYVAAMKEAAERATLMQHDAPSIRRYREAVQLERFMGFCYVRGRAIDLCVDLGLDAGDVFAGEGSF